MKHLLKILMLISLVYTMIIQNVYAQSDTLLPRDCIIYLKDGRKIGLDRFSKIDSVMIEYERDGSLHDVMNENVWKIRCGYTYFRISKDSLISLATPKISRTYGQQNREVQLEDEPFIRDPSIDYAALGRLDASAQYSMVPGVVTGFFTASMLIVAPMVAATPPSPSQQHNPNRQLYAEVPEYKAAYLKKAHGKKATGVLIGVMTFVALIAAVAAE